MTVFGKEAGVRGTMSGGANVCIRVRHAASSRHLADVVNGRRTQLLVLAESRRATRSNSLAHHADISS